MIGARTKSALVALVLVCAPLLIVGPALFGARTFVPFDLAQYPPIACTLTPAQRAAVTAGQNTDVTEIPLTFLPELRFTKQELAAGRLPQWNPYARSGAPLLATSVVGLLYPPNWLLLLHDDPANGLAFAAYLSLLLGEVLLFGFLRSAGLAVLPALFGALAFVLSGTIYVNAYYYMRLAALAWLPGMLWAVRSASRRRGWSRGLPLAGLATCVAMTWLAGFPSYAAAVTLVAGVYGVFVTGGVIADHGRREGLRLAAALVGAVGLGFALAAVQLLPMFAFFPESNRTMAPTLASRASQAFDTAGLLGYLLPDPFGHPSASQVLPYDHSPLLLWLSGQKSFEGLPLLPPWYNFTEFTVFPGTLTLLLAVAGAFRRGRLRWFALLGWALLIVLAIAPRPLWLLYELPGFRNVPPMRFVGPACVLVAILAALGVQQLSDGWPRRRWGMLGGGAAGVALVCVVLRTVVAAHSAEELFEAIRAPLLEHYRRANPGLTQAVVDQWVGPYMAPARARLLANLDYGAIAFALGAVWCGVVAWLRNGRVGLIGVAIVATLAQQTALGWTVTGGRVLWPHGDSPVRAFLDAQRDAARATGGFTVARGCAPPPAAPTQAFQLPPCTLVPERIRDLNIYTFVDKRSHLPFDAGWGPEQLVRAFWVNALPDDVRLESPYLDLLGVRLVLADRVMQHAGKEVGPVVAGPGCTFRIYERPHAMPRAFTVPRVRVVEDPGGEPGADGQAPVDLAIARALVASDFDPHGEVLLSEAMAQRLRSRTPGGAPRPVTFVRDEPEDIEVHVAPGERGYLVMNDTAMSGWTATVNGAPAPLLRGNLFMRVIELPAGEADVRLHYRTPGLVAGAAVTGAALLLLAGLLVGWGVDRWRAPPREVLG